MIRLTDQRSWRVRPVEHHVTSSPAVLDSKHLMLLYRRAHVLVSSIPGQMVVFIGWLE